VDADVRLLANLDVHDVVLVDVDLRLHFAEVRDAHDFRAGELARTDDALTDAAFHRADGAVRGRADGRFAHQLADLPHASLGTLHVEFGRPESSLRDVVV